MGDNEIYVRELYNNYIKPRFGEGCPCGPEEMIHVGYRCITAVGILGTDMYRGYHTLYLTNAGKQEVANADEILDMLLSDGEEYGKRWIR